MTGQFNFGVVNPLKYFVFVSSGLGFLFTLIKNDEQLGFWLSALQWQLQTVLPVLIIVSCYHGCYSFERFRRLPLWWRLIVAGICGGTLFSPIALALDVLIGEEVFEHVWWLELLDEWFGVTLATTAAWLMINWPMLAGVQYQQVINDAKNNTQQHSTELALCEDYEILNLAGIDELSSVVAMSAQLHYVDVLLADSHQLVLYSLKEAAEQLPNDVGMQVHRSHWVSYAHIKAFNKKGRQGELIMTNGLSIPISRNNLSRFDIAYQHFLQKK